MLSIFGRAHSSMDGDRGPRQSRGTYVGCQAARVINRAIVSRFTKISEWSGAEAERLHHVVGGFRQRHRVADGQRAER